MKNKKRSVSKFVKIKRDKLSKLVEQLQDTINKLECISFDIPGENDRHELFDYLSTLLDINYNLNKEMGIIQ